MAPQGRAWARLRHHHPVGWTPDIGSQLTQASPNPVVMKPTALTRWTSENSAELYSIRNWGADYFDISPEGNVLVRPYGSQHSVAIDLLELISELRDQDLSTPVLLRLDKSHAGGSVR